MNVGNTSKPHGYYWLQLNLLYGVRLKEQLRAMFQMRNR